NCLALCEACGRNRLLHQATKAEGSMRGSVKKSGASWYVVLDVGIDPATGKRRQMKRRGFPTRKATEGWLGDPLRDARAGQLKEPSRETCRVFLTSWLGAVKVEVEQSTWHGYDWRIRNSWCRVSGNWSSGRSTRPPSTLSTASC